MFCIRKLFPPVALGLAGLVLAPRAAAQQAWSVSGTLMAYFPPDDSFLLPMLMLDRSRLHLEARYNYEALETGSAWVGANFSGRGDVAWEITPMLGAVVGSTSGLAPGYRGTLTWWKLDLYSEGEYVVDFADQASSFFYNWSELAITAVEGVRAGFVAQRTRVYQTERDLQRGILAGFSSGSFSATAYFFNPGDPDPTFVLGVNVEF